MTFQIETVSLTEVIGNIAKAAANKSTISVLEGIKIEYKENFVTLTGYDLELGMVTTIPAQSNDNTETEFIINAKLFTDIIRKLPETYTSFTIDDSYNLIIRSGSIKYQVKAVDTEEYPSLPAMFEDNKISLQQNILKSMINQTNFSVATSDQKPILMGELFDIDGTSGVFNMAALDSVRLALRTEKISGDIKLKYVVPGKALNVISHILKESSDDMAELSSNGKHALFSFNGYTVFSRLLDGEFAKYKDYLSGDFTTEVIVSTDDFSKALEGTLFLINDKVPGYVKCTFDNNKIKIDFRGQNSNYDTEIKAVVSGESLTIGFNPKFMIDALKASDSDKVVIKFQTQLKPFIITPIQGDSFTYLLMPVNLR